MTTFKYNEPLTSDTFTIFAAENYQNIHCIDISEFRNDLKRIIMARVLMRNFLKKGKLQIRLLLNHIIIFNNMFGKEATIRCFFFKCEPELYPILISIFDFLKILPESIPEVNIQQIESSMEINEMLQEL